jgi:DNA-directed RNA polymerase subunit F
MKLAMNKNVKEIKEIIDASTTTSVIGIPGVGISIFLKHLAAQPFGYSIYIDIFGLPGLTSKEFFKELLTKLGGESDTQNESEIVAECRLLLKRLTEKNEKVIIYFGGFDQLKKSFNQEFFHQLRSLRNINQKKVIFIFGICRRIDSLVSENLIDTDLNMLSSIYYLKPYTDEDIRYILSIYGPKTSNEELQKALALSGGHFQFLQLLLRSERLHDPLNDPFIKLSLRNIYQHLTYQQKKVLKKIALQKSANVEDDYLINVGLVKRVGDTYEIFSPLFEQFLNKQTSWKLPAKEARLFKILKQNAGKTVPKDKIFNHVWENDAEKASDWALDALIYRLRRHPAFIAKNYIIENHKKQGYSLLKN